MIRNSYGGANKTNEELLKSVMNWTLECVRYSDIITIFDIRRETHLDKKILSALLKLENMTLAQQLYLAMIWDRVDLAEEKIFVHGAETLGTHNYGANEALLIYSYVRLMSALHTRQLAYKLRQNKTKYIGLEMSQFGGNLLVVILGIVKYLVLFSLHSFSSAGRVFSELNSEY